MDIIKELSLIGIVPVIAINDAKDASPLADALCRGGLPCAEVTFRTDAAEEAIRIMKYSRPEMLVGAGTVLSADQADRAVAAGASFLVSTGLNPDVVSHCLERGYPILPGCATPSDIERAISMGLDAVKFFPAEAAGGIGMIRAMSAPYSKVRFMPTGGIKASNLNEYLSFERVFACGGSWMASSKMISNGDFELIERYTSEAVTSMLDLSVSHIGINSDGNNADRIASDFSSLLGFKKRPTEVSVWSGDMIEVMSGDARGEKGHIAFAANYVDRAAYHLSRHGMRFDMSSTKYNAAGEMTFIYAEDVVDGFAIHLVKR